MPHLAPDWSGAHLLIVHVPVFLLLAAPVLVLVGAFLPPAKCQALQRLALVFMLVGTAMTFAAVATGREAMKTVDSTATTAVILEQHQLLAETTRQLFFVLTLGFAALLFAPRVLQCKIDSRMNTALLAAFLLFYAAGALLLVSTAHQGAHVTTELAAKATAIYQRFGSAEKRIRVGTMGTTVAQFNDSAGGHDALRGTDGHVERIGRPVRRASAKWQKDGEYGVEHNFRREDDR